MENSIPNSEKPKRYLSEKARAAMSAGAKKARANAWGAKRKESAQVRIDADVAAEFEATVPPRDRRRVATGGIWTSLQVYKARKASRQSSRR